MPQCRQDNVEVGYAPACSYLFQRSAITSRPLACILRPQLRHPDEEHLLPLLQSWGKFAGAAVEHVGERSKAYYRGYPLYGASEPRTDLYRAPASAAAIDLMPEEMVKHIIAHELAHAWDAAVGNIAPFDNIDKLEEQAARILATWGYSEKEFRSWIANAIPDKEMKTFLAPWAAAQGMSGWEESPWPVEE